MPAPPHGRRLRLEPLEGRRLLSAGEDPPDPIPVDPIPAAVLPPDPIVVTGTDANDVITLTRVDDHRVEVTIQSFRDPDWTEPTGDPVVQYEVSLTAGVLASPLVLTGSLAERRCVAPTTGTLLVEGGGGTDRIEINDKLGNYYFVSGTHRTDDPPVDQSDPEVVPPLYDESGGKWALPCDVWVPEDPPCAGTLREGIDMTEGAAVGVRFFTPPVILPAIVEPDEPLDPGDIPIAPEAPAVAGLSAEGLPSDVRPRTAILWADADPSGTDVDAGADWLSDDPNLSRLGVQTDGGGWVDWPDGKTGYGPDGSDSASGDGMDAWLETDLEGVTPRPG